MRALLAAAVLCVAAIAPARAAERVIARVYVVRGLIGTVVAPMTAIAGELRGAGGDVVMGSWWQATALGFDACAHKAQPIIIVGHSLGGPAAAAIGNTAKACGAREVTVVSIDPPPNGSAVVRGIRATNFVGSLGGTIAGARNVPTPGYGHIAIINDRSMQTRIVAAALAR